MLGSFSGGSMCADSVADSARLGEQREWVLRVFYVAGRLYLSSCIRCWTVCAS